MPPHLPLLVCVILPVSSPVLAQCGAVELLSAETATDDYFGFSVALAGDEAIIGGRRNSVAAPSAGAAYVYRRTPTGWVEVQTLRASDPVADAQFGSGVLLHGDQLFLSAFNIAGGRGKVYVFQRTDAGWVETAQLTASRRGPDDNFGLNMVACGNELLVGSRLGDTSVTDSGAAFLFEETPAGWIETHVFEPNRPLGNSRFGHAVAMVDDVVAIGAFGAENFRGRTYVFERTAGTWTQTANLTAGARDPDDRFGIDLDLSGPDLLVGCRRDDAAGTNVGSLYVFRRGAAGWRRVQKILPSFTGLGEEFGARVAVRGDLALVGAFAVLGGRSGAAYRMERDASGRWREVERITRLAPQRGDNLGADIGISEDACLIGGFQADMRGPDSGMALLHPFTATELALAPRRATVGTSLHLRACGGDPGQPALLVVAHRDGVPLRQPLGLSGAFDAAGEWHVTGSVLSAPAMDLGLQVWSLSAGAALQISNTAVLEVR